MGEYFREPYNKIQAGFALHAGNLLNQYESLTKGRHGNYEATLLICVLHSLLTICKELIDAMKKNKQELWLAPIRDVPPWMGINRQCIKVDTFSCELIYKRFIEHLRNAVSHPTSPERDPHLPSTGYTTIPDNSGTIARFVFIDSPWVDRGRIASWASSSNEEKVSECSKRFENKYTRVGLTVERNSQGRYEIRRDNEIYIPIFEAELTITSLRTLMIELANYLAQPTMDDWDGKTIHRLVA